MSERHLGSIRWTLLAIALLGVMSTQQLSADELPKQDMITLPVRVVDPKGQPVAGAKVIPWALRSSQGHGLWTAKKCGSEPPTLATNADGAVEVPYPRYTYPEEFIQTTEVTLSINHPEFAFINFEFINVPPKAGEPHVAKLERGATLEIAPLENGKPTALAGLHVMWSDGRWWNREAQPIVTADGALRIPPLPAGKGRVLLVRLEKERATQFSPVIDVDLAAGETLRKQVEVRPAAHIEGALSENVPRPVKNGRIKAQTLPNDVIQSDVDWFTWAPIAEDGTFVIESWPADEAIQITALCAGFIAESGKAPAVVKKLRDPDPYYRPQVFPPEAYHDRITIPMTALVHCVIEAVDPKGSPLAGVKVEAYPNIGWWNGGSQLYGSGLVRGERLLLMRDYQAAVEDASSYPHETVTDSQGRGELLLPAGEQNLRATHDEFELPIIRGRRGVEVQLVAGAPTTARLTLQPKGNEYLGEWDKLSGVLFGCTGDQCRRLLEDPGFRKRIAVVGEKLDSAKNPTDPAVLKDAYLKMAAAFDEVKDKEEAAKWRRKAAEQAAKADAAAASERTASPAAK